MRTHTVVLLATVICSLLVLPQAVAKNGILPADENCAFTYSSGQGHGFTQYCVNANGNIVSFQAGSASGIPVEMLSGAAPASEGYAICDINTLTPYYDYARNDSGNWGAATSTIKGNSLIITRTTSDGIWKLVQTITQKKGSKTAFGAAQIKMSVSNLSNVERLMIIYRHANVDVAGGTFNDFDTSETSTFATVPGNGGFAAIAAFVTTQFDFHFSMVQTNPDGQNPCVPFGDWGGQQSFFQGDGAMDHYFNLDILPGRTKSVTVTYEPI